MAAGCFWESAEEVVREKFILVADYSSGQRRVNGDACVLWQALAQPILGTRCEDLHFCNELQIPEEASASESASEINTGIRLNNYSGITRQSLATTGFARSVLNQPGIEMRAIG